MESKMTFFVAHLGGDGDLLLLMLQKSGEKTTWDVKDTCK